MESGDFNITIHMVSSLDGFIAKKDNSVGWFETTSPYEKGASAPDVAAFLKTIDCYVMGSRTYELALELSKEYGWVYGDIPTFVLTSRLLPTERNNIECWSGDLSTFVEEKLKPKYRNVWLVGGAQLAKSFITAGLATDIRQSIIPVLLGEGKLFYDTIGKELPLHLKNVTAYKNGMVELWYGIKKAT